MQTQNKIISNEEALKELRKMSDVDFAKFYQTLPPRVQLLLRGQMFEADTEADARAKMLVYLLENNLIKK